MKFGVFTVSIPDWEPLEALERLAAMGYDGVEWRCTEDKGDRSKPSFWSGNRTSMTAREIIEKAPALKKKAAEVGMAMPSLGSYINCNDLADVELHMQAAVAIGAKSLRIDPGRYDPKVGGYPELLKKARSQYAKVAKLAQKYGVRAVLETHMGQLGPSVGKAVSILGKLDPECVGIMWDPGNQVVEGGEVPLMALEIAGEYLAEVHVKNTRFQRSDETKDGQTIWWAMSAPVNEGIVNWPVVMAALKKVGYDGWMFFEDFCTEQPLVERLQGNLKWFRELDKGCN
jgi:sugar phosphate isomerase/epimerase